MDFQRDEIIEVPGAMATYADFVNSSGGMVGSYVGADGLYHAYGRTPEGKFLTIGYLDAANLEYFLYTVSTRQMLSLVVRKRWVMSRARMSVHSSVGYRC